MAIKRDEYAIKMLNVLQDNWGKWVAVKGIMVQAGISMSVQAAMLKTLHHLDKCEVVERSAQGGTYYWKLRTRAWNATFPFTNPNTGESIPFETEGDADRPKRQKSEVPAPSNGKYEALVERLKALEGAVARRDGTIKIEHWDGEIIKLKGVVLPKVFMHVMDLAKARRCILLVGPAGCGKTHLGSLIADSLGLDFGSVSVTSGMSETHLLGRSIPDFHNGKPRFQSTEFLRLYENGGVFLMDEVDAGDSNLLLAINSALANGYANVPNRPEKPRAMKHKDFVLIATANTFGRGATRVYSGRNQLDEATLDRFRIGTIECSYDEEVEAMLCPSDKLRTHLQTIRRRIADAGLRRIMSTRFIQDAYIMEQSCKWTLQKIVDVFFEGWPTDERNKVYVPVPSELGGISLSLSEPKSEDDMSTDGVDYILVNGEPHCPQHGKMMRMMSDTGFRCSQSGTYDVRTKKFSNCNCHKFDKPFKAKAEVK